MRTGYVSITLTYPARKVLGVPWNHNHEHRVMILTTDKCSTVACDPREPSPMAILLRLTGEFGVWRRCFVMYG